MRLLLAILVGKIISLISRSIKLGGGSAAPGLYALKIDPDLVTKLIHRIPRNIIITGTNGKTTTARILAHLASASNLKVIRNTTGSNLERGIASSLISNFSPFTKFQLGIWELDEFAFNSVAPKIKPDLVLFLNLSRDQLDRYGEVNQIVNRWSQTLGKINCQILINSDLNPLKKFKAKQFQKPKNIKVHNLESSQFEITINQQPLIINLPLPGQYNIDNAIAAIEAASELGLPVKQLTESLKDFSPAFGRVEKLPFGYIFLIKNPVGATQVFETLAPQIKQEDKLLIALNDNLADGTDVSWIWDAEFERLKTGKSEVTCSGNRANELAVRLKYAGFMTNQITVIPGLEKALQEARKGLKGQLYILPTYTALLKIQSILTKEGVKSHYWKE